MSSSPAEKNKSLQLREECRTDFFYLLFITCSVYIWALKIVEKFLKTLMLKLSESKYEKNSGDTDGIGDIFGFYNLNSCSKAVVLDVWIDLNALIGVWF